MAGNEATHVAYRASEQARYAAGTVADIGTDVMVDSRESMEVDELECISA